MVSFIYSNCIFTDSWFHLFEFHFFCLAFVFFFEAYCLGFSVLMHLFDFILASNFRTNRLWRNIIFCCALCSITFLKELHICFHIFKSLRAFLLGTVSYQLVRCNNLLRSESTPFKCILTCISHFSYQVLPVEPLGLDRQVLCFCDYYNQTQQTHTHKYI